jgi:hypothetical protein
VGDWKTEQFGKVTVSEAFKSILDVLCRCFIRPDFSGGKGAPGAAEQKTSVGQLSEVFVAVVGIDDFRECD